MYNKNFNTIGKNYHFNHTIRQEVNDFKPQTINKKLNDTNGSFPFSNSLPASRSSNITNINPNNNQLPSSNPNNANTSIKAISISNANKFINNVNLGASMNQQERVINFGRDSSENSFKRNLRKVGDRFNPIQTSSYNIITGIPYSNHNSALNNLNYITSRNKSLDPTSTTLMLNKNILANSGYNFSMNNKNFRNTPNNNLIVNGYKSDSIFSNETVNKEISSSLNTIDINRAISNNKSLTHNNNNIIDSNSILNLNVNKNPVSPNTNIEPMTKEKQENNFTNPINNNGKSLLTTNNNINKQLTINKRGDDTSYYVKDCFSVKEYAYKEDPNTAYRNQMEDMSKAIDRFADDDDKGLFTIFDGHGGWEVAAIAKNRLPEIFEKMLVSNNENNPNSSIENILMNLFHEVDEEIKVSEDEHIGCTATVVYITKEKDTTSNNPNNTKRVVYCANVGDSRCVLINSYGPKRMSKDHKVSDPAETKRIASCGGIIFAGRVYGQLILSRALGDFSLKKHGVIATPYVSKYYLTDKDKYIVVASDGVWDVINDEELFRISQTVSNSDEFVKKIISNSLMRGTQDNISCFVIKLN